ncbi:MAG: fatty acid desaturase [Rhodobacteraceae bacterium]|jgi:fatty acid desaturase|uniref:fatty acid desaturase n=1 Tax=Albidovulum sp. TaxID=1872424 RepID=UPI002658BCC9|nr:fatty acid desaturase [uncultured Defluviimonas sp.]MCC0069792.1 fatty acid desaturase [Paracoccaceae bacterium]
MARGADTVEWPTLLLVAACYALWAAATTWAATLWLPLALVVLTLAVTLHSSIQHEVLHGHPFRSRRLNEALVFLPVGLFFPYGRFRDLHLAHHRDERLTDPYDDPESNFLDPKVWAGLPRWRQRLLRFNNTLLGRMAIGPALSIVAILRDDARAIRRGDRRIARDWALHLAGLGLVGLWIAAAPIPLWGYILSAYLGMSLLKIRTFLEHRAHEEAPGRTVVVERGGVLGFLFLNNNLHIVHHSRPRVAWYQLPALYSAEREAFLARNHGYSYRSYGEIFRRYFVRPKDPVPHPLRPGN